MKPWLVVIALGCTAALKPLRTPDKKAPPEIALPKALSQTPLTPLALSPSEQRLVRRKTTTLAKGRYGQSLVTIVRVTGGVREHHPVSVCLRSSGLQVTRRQQLKLGGEFVSGGLCIELLNVRSHATQVPQVGEQIKGSAKHREASLAVTYLDADGSSFCDLTSRIAAGIWGQLTGQPLQVTRLQVLDVNPIRAVERLAELARALNPFKARQRSKR
jgi:hypothetical protein